MKTQQTLGNHTKRLKKNVNYLRAKPPALRHMRDQTHPPKRSDQTVLEGGPKLGTFWAHCKSGRRCVKFPYDRLLTNSVLRADYRCSPSVTRE